jgi:3-hydroxyisobutyrate dehydrogenase
MFVHETPSVVGLIGIGQMGLPVATNLIQAGYRVAGYRRTNPEAFVACGGELMGSPAAVANAAQIILMCLPNEQSQLDTLDDLLPALGSGHTVIELGTYRKAFKTEQAARILQRGAAVLEAEISGSPLMVAQRRAAFYIGGAPSVFAACDPVLEAVTPHRFHLGEYGCAVTMKLIANYLLTIHTLAAAEAMNLGKRAGFVPHQVAEVISQGAGNSTMFALRAPLMAERRFLPASGPFLTLEKYLDFGQELVQQTGAASPLFSVAAAYFHRALAQGMGEEDISAVIKLLEAESPLI